MNAVTRIPDAEKPAPTADVNDGDYNLDYYDDDQCWNCGGEGVVYSCISEYACINPEYGCDLCERRCDVCRPPKRGQP